MSYAGSLCISKGLQIKCRSYALLWFQCKMFPIDSHAWGLDPQMEGPFGMIAEPLGGEASQEEKGHGNGERH